MITIKTIEGDILEISEKRNAGVIDYVKLELQAAFNIGIFSRSEYLQIIKHGITQFGFNALELSTLHKHGEPYND